MMFEQIEHPDITTVGDTKSRHSPSTTCVRCGFTAPAEPDDTNDENGIFYCDDGPVCGLCLEKEFDDLSIFEKAGLMGADRIA